MIIKIFAILVIIIILMIYFYFINRSIFDNILLYSGIKYLIEIIKAYIRDMFGDVEIDKSINYSKFNELYNMNYYRNKLYKTNLIEKLQKTEAFVLYEPEIFEVYLYEKKIKLYKAEILYKIENKFYENDEYLITFLNEFKDEPYKKLIKILNKNNFNKHVFIRTTIIT
jgi:hypothetical protein